MSSIGWDIGGVNVKVARVAGDGPVQALTEPFSIEHDADRLLAVLERLGRDIGVDGSRHARDHDGRALPALPVEGRGRRVRPRCSRAGVSRCGDAGARHRRPFPQPGRGARASHRGLRIQLDRDGHGRGGRARRCRSCSTWEAPPPTSFPSSRAGYRRSAGRIPTGWRAASSSTAVRCAPQSRHWCGTCRGAAAWPLVSADDFAHTADVHLWLGTRLIAA